MFSISEKSLQKLVPYKANSETLKLSTRYNTQLFFLLVYLIAMRRDVCKEPDCYISFSEQKITRVLITSQCNYNKSVM